MVIGLKSETPGFESKDCQAVWASERLGEGGEGEEYWKVGGWEEEGGEWEGTRLIIFINH